MDYCDEIRPNNHFVKMLLWVCINMAFDNKIPGIKPKSFIYIFTN